LARPELGQERRRLLPPLQVRVQRADRRLPLLEQRVDGRRGGVLRRRRQQPQARRPRTGFQVVQRLGDRRAVR